MLCITLKLYYVYSRNSPCDHSYKRPALVTTTFRISEEVAYESFDCIFLPCFITKSPMNEAFLKLQVLHPFFPQVAFHLHFIADHFMITERISLYSVLLLIN